MTFHPSDKSSISGQIWTCWKYYKLRTRVTRRWRHTSANLSTSWYLQACPTSRILKSEVSSTNVCCTDAGAILNITKIYSNHEKEIRHDWVRSELSSNLQTHCFLCIQCTSHDTKWYVSTVNTWKDELVRLTVLPAGPSIWFEMQSSSPLLTSQIHWQNEGD